MERPVSLDIHSLSKLHRAHLTAFTWEALDAFMGWSSTFDPASTFAKMVEGRRGGWCFEMNGLFGAALEALGFRVTRLCGCVDRANLGDIAIGNHLTLRVDLDRPYLAEVGAADALFDPVPLAVGPIGQRGFDFSITATDDGWLRLNNHAHGIARIIDFRPDYSDEPTMRRMQGWLLQDAGSPFTGALAVFRHTERGYISLQNDMLRDVTAAGVSELRVMSANHLAGIFETIFDLDIPRPEQVWERIQAIARAKAA
ncbi:MAG: arylamine N-acetyltransferase [Sphingobium sp.]|nr:arylamine N-acetyltransferase [Sphingobium sp.]